MQNSSLHRRTVFTINLLSQLKEIYNILAQLTSNIEDGCDCYYEKIYIENGDHIRNGVKKYKENYEKIKELNYEITTTINAWFDFIKNPVENKKLIFPVRFYFNKRNTEKQIKRINESISKITIENRFITEQLTSWQHELEVIAIQQIKQSDKYSNFDQLLTQKNDIISELKYLLPTLPDICPVEIAPENIENLIEKISKMAAA